MFRLHASSLFRSISSRRRSRISRRSKKAQTHLRRLYQPPSPLCQPPFPPTLPVPRSSSLHRPPWSPTTPTMQQTPVPRSSSRRPSLTRCPLNTTINSNNSHDWTLTRGATATGQERKIRGTLCRIRANSNSIRGGILTRYYHVL